MSGSLPGLSPNFENMSKKPNVLVFFTDQQRWDTSGLHGCPLHLTPNFDRLASGGTHIDASITCQPVCGPARACLQTGLYATQTGTWKNSIPLNPDLTTLAHRFSREGYHTGYIGKWHLGSRVKEVPPEERGGYDYWLASNLLEFTSDAYDTVLYDKEDQPVKLPGYRVDAMTDAGIRYIHEKSQEDDPFFLFMSFIEPHHQNHLDDYPPPIGYREAYTGRWTPPDLQALGGSSGQHLGGYFGMVKRLDEALGRIQDALVSLDLDRETIVLFTSDHGCHFKTRNSEYKRSCHEASVRVPTAFWGPGFEMGGRRREVTSLIDLVPTLLDAANIPGSDELPGRSLLPRIQGASTPWRQEVFIQITEDTVGRAFRTDRWKYCVTAPELDARKVGSADSYLETHLYDLHSDPYDLQNLIDCEAHRELAGLLRNKLLKAMEAAGEDVPTIREPETIHPKGQRVVLPEELEGLGA